MASVACHWHGADLPPRELVQTLGNLLSTFLLRLQPRGKAA